ncbi:hypothetical protein M406DRAFT_328662 [Cryphonectria parasitica EP155]|uniref:Uncharacterized protein n=1 Tax=Cryphonectria parasitica (strain ATCC 38755 / EP155) TaxID=660469 RepID=A0A9P4Y6W3_CRYP1|nr:uncharacterized protein M406DRAFT_328662 [Cryphonectria parasitica EP155]KAF3767590.1 hypothetical protein M406DRAFT_328662 [Cryphonectria parasitica EP155]
MKHVRPLRIVKRPDSVCGVSVGNVDDQASRRSSQETNKSRGSAPDPPGGDRPLTLPKTRGHRNSRLFGNLDNVDETPVPLGRGPYLSKGYEGYCGAEGLSMNGRACPPDSCNSQATWDAHAMDSFRPRHSPKLRGRGLVRSAAGFRDQFSILNSQQAISTAHCPFPGLIDIIQRSKTANSLSCREPSPLALCNDGEVSDDPFTTPTRHTDYDIELGTLLVPDVRITPETRVVDTGYQSFWIAVEISARLHRPDHGLEDSAEDHIPRSQRPFSSVGFDTKSDVLHDVQVEVESTSKSRVLEVIEHEASPNGHVRSQSDELMEDLEDHLGSAQCEYLKVNIIYRHSVFSSMLDPASLSGLNSGVVSSQTRLRTTFTAAIARYNAASPWSPPPAPTPNRLLGIIAAHWGMDAADDLLRNKLVPQKITPRKTTYLAYPRISSRSRGRDAVERASKPVVGMHVASPTRPAPPPPIQDDAEGPSLDAASKIWEKIRRCSGLSMAPHRRKTSTSTISSVAASVSLPFSVDSSADSWAIRRKRANVHGSNSLMIQRQRLAAMGSRTSLVDRTNLSMVEDGSVPSTKRRSPKGDNSGGGRKSSGKWGFTNWLLNG